MVGAGSAQLHITQLNKGNKDPFIIYYFFFNIKTIIYNFLGTLYFEGDSIKLFYNFLIVIIITT